MMMPLASNSPASAATLSGRHKPVELEVDFLNIVLIASVAYGILQVPLLGVVKSNSLARVPLIILVIVLTWIQIEFFVIRNGLTTFGHYFFGNRYGSWLFLGPSLYFVIRALLRQEIKIRTFVAHLLPAIVLVMILPLFVQDAIPERAVNYGMLTVLAYGEMGYTFWQGFYGIVFIFQFLHLAFYVALSMRFLSMAESVAKDQVSQIYPGGWLKIVLSFMILIIVASSVFFYQLLINFQYQRYWDFLFIIPFAALTYYIVLKLNQHPASFRSDLKEVKSDKKYRKSGLDEDLLQTYANRVESVVMDKKLYLQPDLTLNSLSEAVNIKPHHLSQVFSSALGITFFDYINRLRIEESKSLLLENNNTVLTTAMKSGFANKASFNKYFKAVTGVTPSEFIKKETR